MKKIGLFGGSFNPIHLGHLAMARLAVEHFQLDHLFFIPAAEHPFAKETLTVSAETRAEMILEAIDDDPQFSMSRCELDREGTSFAVDTIEKFCNEYPEAQIHYLIGMDNLPTFDKWHRYTDILNMVTLMVADRPGFTGEYSLEGDIQFFPSPHWGISSSQIREYRSKGLSCRYLLHERVEKYISENNLYSK